MDDQFSLTADELAGMIEPPIERQTSPRMSAEDTANQEKAIDIINQLDALRHAEKRPELRQYLRAAINALCDYGSGLVPPPDLDHDVY